MHTLFRLDLPPHAARTNAALVLTTNATRNSRHASCQAQMRRARPRRVRTNKGVVHKALHNYVNYSMHA